MALRATVTLCRPLCPVRPRDEVQSLFRISDNGLKEEKDKAGAKHRRRKVRHFYRVERNVKRETWGCGMAQIQVQNRLQMSCCVRSERAAVPERGGAAARAPGAMT